MAVGRVLWSCAALVAIAGCAAVAVGMSRAATAPDGAATPFAMPTLTAQVDQPVATWTPRLGRRPRPWESPIA